MTNTKQLSITKLGAAGDGIAIGDDGPMYVPLTLPGDLIKATFEQGAQRGRLQTILKPAPDRNKPVCKHFTQCGGCTSQHMSKTTYAKWKRSLIEMALANRDINTQLNETFSVGNKARRRATFTAKAQAQSNTPTDGAIPIVLGFHKEGTHEIVDMVECPVLEGEIVGILPNLRKLVTPLVRHIGDVRIHVLSAANGLSIDLSVLPAKLPRAIVARLCLEAAKLGVTRVTLDNDPIYAPEQLKIICGPADVTPPPGVFLQASAAAEQKMVDLIIKNLPKRTKRIADLFCGLGAFTFPLAKRAQVTSLDSDARAIEALKEAIRHTKGVKKIDTRVRDLFQEPLSRKELEDFEAVVFDPPRAGAKQQAQNLAKSKVPVVIAISCNPATFARDARILIDGGYTLQNVTPIDQFLYAAHVELVAVFRR